MSQNANVTFKQNSFYSFKKNFCVGYHFVQTQLNKSAFSFLIVAHENKLQ